MTDLALRPRSATEIVDLAVRLLRRHFVGFFTVALVGLIPNLVVQLVLRATLLSDPAAVVARFGSVAAITMPVSVVFTSLMVGSLVAYADDALRTGAADVGRAIGSGAARLTVVIGVWFLWALATLVGLAVFFVPGVYVSLRLATAVPAAVVEGDGVVEALRRAWARGDGQGLHTFKTLLLLLLIFVVFFLAVGIIDAIGVGVLGGVRDAGGMRAFAVVSQVLFTLAAGVGYPLFTNVLLLLTYDLRVRREGYDVEAMAAALGAAG